MQNYKVRVNDESESKEVQELFFDLGYSWSDNVKSPKYLEYPVITSYEKNHELGYGVSLDEFYDHKNKELTIPQLRDLVVLHCNNISDATHTGIDENNEVRVFISSNGDRYFWNNETKKWLSEIEAQKIVTWFNLKDVELKPISKKEYLTKQVDGTYQLTLGSGDVEVPDGAELFVIFNDDIKNNCFYKENLTLGFDDTENYWWESEITIDAIDSRGGSIMWQRQTPPETMHTRCVQVPVNFEVEKTLQERQSQYGDFSDVAELTSDLMGDLLRDDMSFVQREALHMICSKLARMRHGDINKIDTWHDIAGYATLVVKDLEKKESD